MKKLIALSVILFALSGCKREASVDAGKIVNKYHEGATTRTNWGCYPNYKGKLRCGFHTRHTPNRWVFVLEDCDVSKKCRVGELEVSQRTYDSFGVGSQYPSASSANRK